ncbi:hypothetical protein G4B88_029288 [Cannabis sativa]|uniref:Uncharacterized protein n=1 Tax=Cannabis sativa TaxID=3483 RepID=A0A7J6FYU4_CANSA|nr:hypothetical protein G4B88_029288 [Cannabis sativa]
MPRNSTGFHLCSGSRVQCRHMSLHSISNVT